MLGVDNSAAISIMSCTQGVNWRTRHLKIKAGAVQEALDQRIVEITHIPGRSQIADIGTKTLPARTLRSLQMLMAMILPEGVSGSKFEVAVKKFKKMDLIVWVGLDSGFVNWVLMIMTVIGVLFCAVQMFKLVTKVWRTRSYGVFGVMRGLWFGWRHEMETQTEDESRFSESTVTSIWLSPHGECFHVSEECRGLKVARSRDVKRRCTICG